jgi:hypothetical protein
MAVPSSKRLHLRIPLLAFIAQIIAIALTECVRMYRGPCVEPCSSRLLRAVQLSVTASGTTFLGVALALVYPIAEGMRTYAHEGRLGVKKLFKEKQARTLGIAVVIWLVLISLPFRFH